jgi:hypothetical protein
LISSKAKFAVAGAALALFLSAKVSAQSETLYVIEHLVVSVNSTADGSGERVGQISSGDRVEVLERQDEQMRVLLPSGQEGWVRSSYLSTNPPLREQLKARGDELEKLKQEKTKLETELAGARKAAAAATAAAAASTAAHVSATPAPPRMPDPATTSAAIAESSPDPEAPVSADSAPSNPPIFSGEGIVPSRPSWVAALVVSALALGVGFALGWRMLDRRIRAKYGGLRIY